MWEHGKGLLCVGGGKGSAVCGRRERVSCVWKEVMRLLFVGGGKGSAVCGRRENIICMREEGMQEEEGKGRTERVFLVWEKGRVCCMWEDGRGLLSVGIWNGSSGCGRRDG